MKGFIKKCLFFGGHGKNRSLKSLIHGVLGHGMWYEFTQRSLLLLLNTKKSLTSSVDVPVMFGSENAP